MTVFVLAYDLRNEAGNQGYEKLWAELKRYNAHRIQDSVWLINVNSTASDTHAYFKKLMDSDDFLMVSELTRNHGYTAYAGTTDWIKRNPPAR